MTFSGEPRTSHWPGINLYPELGAVAPVESQSRQLAPATDHEAHLDDKKGNKVM